MTPDWTLEEIDAAIEAGNEEIGAEGYQYPKDFLGLPGCPICEGQHD